MKISFCFKMAAHCFKRRIARYLTSIIVQAKQSYLNFNFLMKLLCDISWHIKTTTIQHLIVWKLEILQLHRRQNAWHEDIQETLTLFCSTAVFGLLHKREAVAIFALSVALLVSMSINSIENHYKVRTFGFCSLNCFKTVVESLIFFGTAKKLTYS